ncbi:MAG: SPOR domain-containing protein [Hyphomicrobiales bacterium]|nr:MAG: SPOR domain-containing protein [Hyphomicrobiales bacterium]
MAARSTQASRSGGFFKLYMFIWAVAAAAALAYLASLATAPDLSKSVTKEAQAEAEQPLRLASRALSEIGTVRRTVGDMQRDIAQIRDTLTERDATERQTQSRIAALEEKVTSLPPSTAPVAAATPPAAPVPKQKAADKAKAKDKAAPEARSTSRLSRVEGEEKDGPDDPYAQPRVETGSLAGQDSEQPAAATPPPPVQPVVTFGAPVVTPSKGKGSGFAVQIGAGSSVDALRATWKQLQSKHDNLSGLEARVVAPKAEGGKYRLVAGPFASKADAEKACTDMGVGRTGCFSTSFHGDPL